MGGIDLVDRSLIKKHRVNNINLCRFYYIFDIIANNAWRLMRASVDTKVTFKHFLKKIIINFNLQKNPTLDLSYKKSLHQLISVKKNIASCALCKKRCSFKCVECSTKEVGIYLHKSCKDKYHNKICKEELLNYSQDVINN